MAHISKGKALRALRGFWQRIPFRKIVIGVVVALIGTVIGGLTVLYIWEWRTGGYDGKGGEQLTEKQREMKCKELRVIFYGRLKVFDATYEFSSDSLTAILSHLYGGQRPQLIPVEIKKFWKPALIRRNSIIDSFLVAFESNGCDANELHYTRHLRK